MQSTTIAVDTAKLVFEVVVSKSGRVLAYTLLSDLPELGS